MNYIKAKKCYICGDLFDLKENGYIIAKKYARHISFLEHNMPIITNDIEDIAICGNCAKQIEAYIKKARASK